MNAIPAPRSGPAVYRRAGGSSCLPQPSLSKDRPEVPLDRLEGSGQDVSPNLSLMGAWHVVRSYCQYLWIKIF